MKRSSVFYSIVCTLVVAEFWLVWCDLRGGVPGAWILSVPRWIFDVAGAAVLPFMVGPAIRELRETQNARINLALAQSAMAVYTLSSVLLYHWLGFAITVGCMTVLTLAAHHVIRQAASWPVRRDAYGALLGAFCYGTGIGIGINIGLLIGCALILLFGIATFAVILKAHGALAYTLHTGARFIWPWGYRRTVSRRRIPLLIALALAQTRLPS